MKKQPFCLTMVLVAFLSAPVVSQTIDMPILVQDVATKLYYSDSNPEQFTEYNGKTYFSADDQYNGRELWVTDGTSQGTQMLKDIYPGVYASSPRIFGIFKGKLYFAASNSAGEELWYTDGTESGTTMLKDINPSGSCNPNYFTVAGNYLYFFANDGSNGRELWVTDGTAGGTHLTGNCDPATNTNGGPKKVVAYGDKIIFGRIPDQSQRADVWVADPFSAPVNLTSNIVLTYYPFTGGSHIIEFGGLVYFNFDSDANGDEMYSTDGTISGTNLIDVVPGANGFGPHSFFIALNKLFCAGFLNGFGSSELFITNGTVGGTTHLGVGCDPYINEDVAVLNGKVYFKGSTPATGTELFSTDGTVNGTGIVLDAKPGTASGSAGSFKSLYGNLYYICTSIDDDQPWISDGTTLGTHKLKTIYFGNQGGSRPKDFTGVNGKVYFSARLGVNAYHLFVTDGTEAGTKIAQPVTATYTSSPLQTGSYSAPSPLKVTNNILYYRGHYDLNVGRELYRVGDSEALSVIVHEKTLNHLVYPNPNNGTFNLMLNGHEDGSIIFTNTMGQKVLELIIEREQKEVKTGLPQGVYFYRFYNNIAKVASGKLVVE